MTIAELGSLGEFVSSIAVLATLLFLSIQIRQSNVLAKRNEMNNGFIQTSPMRLALATQSGVADLLVKGMDATEPLDRAEQVRFDSMVFEVAWAIFHVWDRSRLGLTNDSDWLAGAETLRRIIGSPGGSVWWASRKSQFGEEFQHAVERGLAPTK